MKTDRQLGIILALAGGLVLASVAALLNASTPTASVSSVAEEFETYSILPTLQKYSAYQGHITMIVTDMFGNIKEYREMDNNIVDEGKDCVSDLVFETNDASCDNQTKFTNVVVSNCDAAGSGDATNSNCADTTPDTVTGFDDTEDAEQGDECNAGTVTYTDATNVVRVQAVFTEAEITGESPLRESGIVNACAAGNELFAIQSFADINLATNDQLTVNWDITLTG